MQYVHKHKHKYKLSLARLKLEDKILKGSLKKGSGMVLNMLAIPSLNSRIHFPRAIFSFSINVSFTINIDAATALLKETLIIFSKKNNVSR